MTDATESNVTGRRIEVALRETEPADADECARITYGAFARVHDYHQFPRDFPTLEAAVQLTSSFIAHPKIWGVVAETQGRIVGCNFLDERGSITGVGPITVDPTAQGHGVGRRLMEAILERGAGARGIRLFQDSFNMQSLSLEEGDRVIFMTDGMLERNAEDLDLPAMLSSSGVAHPRELVYELAETVLHATGGDLNDDATVLCLDWRGGPDEPDRPDREE